MKTNFSDQSGAIIAHLYVLGLLSCLMQRCGLDPPLRRIFSVGGYFSLGVHMGGKERGRRVFPEDSSFASFQV